MFKLFVRLRPRDWVYIVVMLGFVVLQVFFDITLPDYMAQLNPLETQPDRAWELGWLMVGCVVGSAIASIVASYFAALVATQYGRRLRADVFSKVQTFGFSEINKFSTASLITRSSNDIAQVQMAFITLLRMGVSSPLTAIWAIAKIGSVDGMLTLSGAAWIVGMLLVLAVMILLFLPKLVKVQKTTDRLNSVARENLTGLRVVKAYSAAGFQQDKFDAVATEARKLDLFVNRIGGFFWPFLTIIMNGLSVTIYWIGAKLVGDSVSGSASFEPMQILSTATLFMQVLFSFMGLIFLLILVPRAIVSSKRINEVLDTCPQVQDTSSPIEFEKSGEIEFDNVSFRYPGAEENILSNISFKASPGQMVAFIGSTGSGKSTVVNLVPRFYDCTEGRILIGGQDIKQVKQQDLLSSIGYVPQKALLFSGSVNNNIAYGLPQLDNEVIEKAAKVASAYDFVSKMDNKFDTHIAQGGKNVSGGQKQRLSIARAVAINPEIFIFDDSFSALDFKTDKAVRAALKQEVGHATSLVVAQRVGSIMDADLIVVLEQGKIAGKGTHKELIRDCEVYREIALSQLSPEELGIA
ncbi:MAG: ABC transporter ATP-binding protein/permease [Firmicutes bacterium]|nr:ABC transporter ATP-binding protein/permease [Bacillota bacterium]